MAKVDRNKLKADYRQLHSKVAAILFEADPVGINFGSNQDEYELEASTILPRLKDCASQADVQRVLLEEFIRWFGVEHIRPDEISSDVYAEPAAKIWDHWQRSLCNPAR